MENNTESKDVHQGQWIKALLDENSFSFAEAADRIGKDPSTIQRWTKKKKVEHKNLKLISDIFHLDLRDYFDNMDHLYSNRNTFRDKYFELLEKQRGNDQKYQQLLEKYNGLLEKYNEKLEESNERTAS